MAGHLNIPNQRPFKTTTVNLEDIMQEARRIGEGSTGTPVTMVDPRWGRSVYSDAPEHTLLRRYWWPWVADEFPAHPHASAFQAVSAQASAAGNQRFHHRYAPSHVQESNRYALFESHGLDAQRLTSFPDMMTMNDYRAMINRHSFLHCSYLFDHQSRQNLTSAHVGFKSLAPYNISDGLGTHPVGNHSNETTFRTFLQRPGFEVEAGQQSISSPYVRNSWENKNWPQRACFTETDEQSSLLKHGSEARIISSALNTPVNGVCNCLDQAYRMSLYQAKHIATQEGLTPIGDSLGRYERRLPFIRLSSEDGVFFKQLPY